ncbi:MAG: YibE/F family protein [Marmoricola sp.]|nr:YibE/F family protein [Marmoricola sp.]
MGHSHSHSHRHGPSTVEVGRGPLSILIGFLALVAVATVIGVVVLWPNAGTLHKLRETARYDVPGTTFPKAEVTAIAKPCKNANGGSGSGGEQTTAGTVACGTITALVKEGPGKGTSRTVGVPSQVIQSGLAKHDTVRLILVPASHGQPAGYSFDDVDRGFPLLLMGLFLVLVVGAVARVRGLLAIASLGFAGFVLLKFMLPALLSGSSGIGVALAGSAAIMFVVLYLAHGFSVRTSAALAGTLLGVGVTALIGEVAIHGSSLSGFGDESSALLSTYASSISFQGLFTCALVVAGLGVLNDVTITQASAVWELREAGTELTRANLFTSAMRIGRDHIASTIYTIVFAYAGSALAVLLLLSLYDRPIFELLSSENISEEIIRTLASAIGLVLAVPITTAIAVLTVGGPAPIAANRAPGRRIAD